MANPKDFVDLMDTQIIFNAAECFKKVSDLAELHSTKIADENISLGLINSAITNHALAIELYLKCLQVIETGRFLKSHNLLLLFEELSGFLKNRIESHFKDRYTYFPDFLVVEVRDKEYSFIEILAEAQNAFTEHRYYFEKSSIKYKYALQYTTNCIRGIILENDPKIITQPIWF